MKTVHWAIIFSFIVLLLPSTSLSEVLVSDFVDFSFGSYSGSGGDLALSDDLCVYNSASKKYRITASGSGTGGAFQLLSGGGTLNYQVGWSKATGGFTLLSSGVSLAVVGADKKSSNCGGSNNARVQVTLTQGALDAASPGSYGGVLTIMVEPD